MSKLDVYLRSIERFGAAGAVLVSGQAVTLRFPTGDRHATQVTPHDQLVVMVREIAPPAALDAIDKQRPAKFDVESQGTHYTINVQPRPGAWQVEIAPGQAPAAATPAPVAPSTPAARAPGRAPSTPVDTGEMLIERGQYDTPVETITPTTSGSAFLDQLTHAARTLRATDVYLSAGGPPLARTGGDVSPIGDRGAVEAEQLSREVGIVAPASARAAWLDGAPATFAYGDGAGRVRVTLSRDRRGPSASLRLLHGEPPALDRLSLGPEVARWLGESGLVVIAGASNVGKTTLLAALVRALGERKRHVVSLEDPIEILQSGVSVSQREIGEHVPSFAAGVEAAMREGADAIVLGAVTTAESAQALVDAVAGGHLVVTTMVGDGKLALSRALARIGGDRSAAEKLCLGALLGTITPAVARSGGRTYEVNPP
ncbi:MAG: ATPase, T2SS/T4P/T4SS family [Kofleriaceae bacterium]